MTKKNNSKKQSNFKALINEDVDLLKKIIQTALQEILEGEMEDLLGAKKGERNTTRSGYRSGYYTRNLMTRVGKIELRIPQDRNGFFRTELFEHYQRSEKALVSTLMEMYVQGVSTRKVKKITEELCGYKFSASTVSNINKKLDKQLGAFANRELKDKYPYLILDTNYKKVRENGVVKNLAILTALGVNWEGRRDILSVELSNRERKSSWKDFLLKLKKRGLNGVEFVVSDNHEGIKSSVAQVFPLAIWQRCYVHFLRNALDYLPRRKTIDDVLLELRWIYERSNIKEAKESLTSWLLKWQSKYPKLCDWVEENIEETLSFYHLPRQHHKNMKSSNVIKRVHEEFKRRTFVIRIFPDKDSCLRLIRAIAVEVQDRWIEQPRYINMDFYKELKKKRNKDGKLVA